MDDKELYRQKKQAELDLWKAELDKMKAQAAKSGIEIRQKLNQQIEVLENKIEEGKTKLLALAEASDDAWGSIQDGVESAWKSLMSAFKDAASKFKPSSRA